MAKGYVRWSLGDNVVKDEPHGGGKFLVTMNSLAEKHTVKRVTWREGIKDETCAGDERTDQQCRDHLHAFVEEFGVDVQWQVSHCGDINWNIYNVLSDEYGRMVLKGGWRTHSR